MKKLTRCAPIQSSIQCLLVFLISASAACTSGPPSSRFDPGQDVAPADVGIDASPDIQEEDAGESADAREITVATYNLYLLFDTTCDSRRCGPNDFEQQRTQAEFDARIAEVAHAIDELDADVVMVQEVETQGVLEAVNDALKDPYPIVHLGESGYAGSIDAGILARGELRLVDFYTQLSNGRGGFTRPLVRVDLELDGQRGIFFAAHFKSRFNDTEGRRVAEAETTREIMMEVAAENDDAIVLLGGDLNDEPESEAITAMTQGDGLHRVAKEKHLSEVYTFVYQDQMIAIDHLMLAPTSGGEYIENSVRSVHDATPVGYGGSDHGALVARFRMR